MLESTDSKMTAVGTGLRYCLFAFQIAFDYSWLSRRCFWATGHACLSTICAGLASCAFCSLAAYSSQVKKSRSLSSFKTNTLVYSDSHLVDSHF